MCPYVLRWPKSRTQCLCGFLRFFARFWREKPQTWASCCITYAAVNNDGRQAGKVIHSYSDLLRQRIYGIASGYPDCLPQGFFFSVAGGNCATISP
jgi:hypothetical protein